MRDVKCQTLDLCASLAAADRTISFKVITWDGIETMFGDKSPAFVLRITSENTANALLNNPIVVFGDAFASGDIEIEGNLRALLHLFFRSRPDEFKSNPLRQVGFFLKSAIPNSKRRSRNNVLHYSAGNKFFQKWLDKEMVYSGAYFCSGEESLDQAQAAKMEYVCRKLLLKPDDRLLDVGCGWGGLVIYAAKRYGVKGVGVTLNEEQASFARRRISMEGLEDKVNIALLDYRDIATLGTFDKIATIGMIEHVGRKHLQTFFHAVRNILRPEGLGFLQTVGRLRPNRLNDWIAKEVFPGAYLPTLAELVRELAYAGFCVHDIENLRTHYRMTLEKWSEGLCRERRQVVLDHSAAFFRAWQLYLDGCAEAFAVGTVHLWQICYSNGIVGDVPLTRAYLYAPAIAKPDPDHPDYATVLEQDAR